MPSRRARALWGLVLSLTLLASCSPELNRTPDDYRERLPALEARTVQRPDDAAAYRDLGEAYAQLQRFELAQQALQRAYDLDADDPKTLYYLGVAHEGVGAE